MKAKVVSIAIALVITMSPFTNCSPTSEGTSTGNPKVAVQFASYDPAGKITTQSVTGLTMCFRRIRFKGVDSTEDFEIVLENNLIALSEHGTELDTKMVPNGTYNRIELKLYDECIGGKSLSLTNSNGSYETDDDIEIRFEGELVVDSSTTTVNLFVQSIVTALNTVTADNQIRTAAESVGGTCDDE